MKRRAMAQNTAQSDTKTFLDDFLVSAVVQESAEHWNIQWPIRPYPIRYEY